jgi:hypothetical protein
VKGLIWTFSGGGAALATGYFLPALRAESPASTATRHSRGKSPGARHLTVLNRYGIEFDEQYVWD